MSIKIAVALLVLISLLGSLHSKNINPRISLPKTEHISSDQRIKSHGYPAESHKVETSDGYLLNTFRLPYSPKLQNQNEYRPAILLQHGFLSCSDAFLLNGPDNALAYNLVDAGYDVWLGNSRGNLYSRNNTKISLNHPYFWRFSWHEIGAIDMAETIDFILEKTGQKKLHYVGHSLGTTEYFVLMSTRPEYNEKIKSANMLAPVAFNGNVSLSAVVYPASIFGPPGLYGSLFGDQEFLPSNPVVQNLLAQACGGKTKFPKACMYIHLILNGNGTANMNMTILPLLAETHPAGVSTNQIRHTWQDYLSNDFAQFDHGVKGNRKRYGQDVPPKYEIDKITSEVYLYYADADDNANPKDVHRLAELLPNLKEKYLVPNPTFGHLDFIFAMTVKTEINDRIIRVCNEYERREKLKNLE